MTPLDGWWVGPLLVLGVDALVLALAVVVPGRRVDGYVTGPDGRKLRYHLNGLQVMVAVVGLAALAVAAGLPADLLYRHRLGAGLTAFVLGLAFTVAVVAPAPAVRGGLADWFLGRLENPQWGGGRVDAKMFLYLVGAVLLELNLLSSAAHHALTYGPQASPGVFLHVALFSFFLCEYLFFEEVHLYTYDFVAERVGFKLGWGCLVWYPFFYNVGLFALADAPPPGTPLWALVGCAALFFSGWMLSRGANLQKFWFKQDATRPAFGVLVPRSLEANGRRVLVSGFWGLSRHINYLGELLMAVGLALSLGYPSSPFPWLYPLYYVALLVPRQLDDDARCAARYGEAWATYRQQVPWRIIPGVY
jgi:protein-S-isoprenylcysteine O-methyltransferase Ste14